MALQIPDARQPISTDVPGYNVSPSTGVADVNQQIGNTLNTIGLNIYTEAKKVEAEQAASNAYYEGRQASDDLQNGLKLKYADGYITNENGKRQQNADGSDRTIVDEFNDVSNERFKTTYAELPNEMAQNAYKQRFVPYYNEQLGAMKNEQLRLNIASISEDQDKNLRYSQNQLESVPDLPKAYSYFQDLSQDAMKPVGTAWNATDGKLRVTKIGQSISASVMDGKVSNVLTFNKSKDGVSANDAIDKSLDILNGVDQDSKDRIARGMPTISDMLTPGKKVQLTDQLIRLREVAKAMDDRDLGGRIENHKFALQAGKGTLNDEATILEDMRKAKKTPFEIAQVNAEWMGAKAINESLSGLDGITKSDDQLVQTAHDAAEHVMSAGNASMSPELRSLIGEVGAKYAHDVDTTLLSKASEITEKRHKDIQTYFSTATKTAVEPRDPNDLNSPLVNKTVALLPRVQAVSKLDLTNASVVRKNAGLIRQAYNDSRTAYDHLYPGMPYYWKPMTEEASNKLALMIKDPNQSDNQSSNLAKALQYAYGRHFPEVMHQLMEDGKLPGQFQITTNPQVLNNGSFETAWAAARSNDTTERTSRETAFGKDDSKALEDAVYSNPSLQKYALGENQANSVQTLTGISNTSFREAVLKQATKIASSPGAGKDWKDISEKAYQAVIGQHVHTIEPGKESYGEKFGNLLHFKSFTSKAPDVLNIPKNMGGVPIGDFEAQAITTYLAAMKTPEALGRLGIGPAKGQKVDPGKFVDALPRQGGWVVSNDQRGFLYGYREDGNQASQQNVAAKKNGTNQIFMIPLKQAITEGARLMKQPGIKDKIRTFLP